MASERKSSWNNRLAKAETVLVLALITEMLLNPWLFSQTQIPHAGQTLLKMLIVVGCFGPVFSVVSRMIDGSLSATRSVTVSVLSLPKLAAHVVILTTLFLTFYWAMHHTLPWRDLKWPDSRGQGSVARG